MSKTYLFSGKKVVIQNLANAVAGGTLVRRAGFVGIPVKDAPAGGSVAFALEGAWNMTYGDYAGHPAGALLPKAGTILYWDTSAAKLSIGYANDDYTAVKCITDVSSTTGAFQGLLLPQAAPRGQDQS